MNTFRRQLMGHWLWPYLEALAVLLLLAVVWIMPSLGCTGKESPTDSQVAESEGLSFKARMTRDQADAIMRPGEHASRSLQATGSTPSDKATLFYTPPPRSHGLSVHQPPNSASGGILRMDRCSSWKCNKCRI